MKKLLLVFMFGALFVLAACGGDNQGTIETTKESDEGNSGDSVTFEEAGTGDVVTDDYGSYEIVKVSENVGRFETGDISFDVQKAFLATFTPTEGEEFYFEDELGGNDSLNLVVTLVSADNSGEEYLNFGPFFAKVFIGGSKPYGAQAFLNVGESEISAGDSQEFVTSYFIEDEELSEVSEVTIEQGAPSADYTSVGDDVEFTISFD